MMKRMHAWMAIAVFCVLTLTVAGCGGGGGSSDGGGGGGGPAALTTFGDDVALCTPQVEESTAEVLAKGISGEADATISDWSGWDPTQEYTVLYNLLTPDCVEGMFDPITKADMFITVLNTLRSNWQTSGTYEDITLDLDLTDTRTASLDLTAVVDTSVTSVTVPYFGTEQAVDRLITLTGTITMTEGEDSSTDTIECEMAFSTTATGEVLVVRTFFAAKNETSMFYGIKDDATGDLRAWAACYVDHGGGNIFSVALKWQGNTQTGTFALTQYKNSQGGAHILAGGEATGDMAFLAEIPDDVGSGGNPWYLVCTTNYLSGLAPVAGEYMGDSDALALDDADVCGYISETANGTGLGYLDAYPESADEIGHLINL